MEFPTLINLYSRDQESTVDHSVWGRHVLNKQLIYLHVRIFLQVDLEQVDKSKFNPICPKMSIWGQYGEKMVRPQTFKC